MKDSSVKKISQGAAWLSIAALIGKILSAIYKVPLQNWTGDEGFYAYQQIYPLYGILSSLALSVWPLFISLEIGKEYGARDKQIVFKGYAWATIILSWLGALMLLLFSNQIAEMMGDPNLSLIIKSVSLFAFILPLLTIGRSFFQSRNNMQPTAISQLVEQIFRVMMILIAAFLYSRGHGNIYSMASWAMAGGAFGAFIGGNYLLRRMLPMTKRLPKLTKESLAISQAVRLLMTDGLVMALFMSVLLLFQMIDSFTIVETLRETIDLPEARNLKGIYDRAQPIIQLGLIINQALLTTLVPQLQSLKYRQRQKAMTFAGHLTKVVMVFSAAATTGLITLMPVLNQFLFEDQKLTELLQVMMISVFSFSVILVVYQVLRIYRYNKIMLYSLLITLILKFIANPILIRLQGIEGSAYTTVGLLSLLALVALSYLPKEIKRYIFDTKFIIKLLLANGLMYGAVSAWVWLVMEKIVFDGRLASLIIILLGVGIGVTVYIIFLLKAKVLSSTEWELIPHSDYLIKGEEYEKD